MVVLVMKNVAVAVVIHQLIMETRYIARKLRIVRDRHVLSRKSSMASPSQTAITLFELEASFYLSLSKLN